MLRRDQILLHITFMELNEMHSYFNNYIYHVNIVNKDDLYIMLQILT